VKANQLTSLAAPTTNGTCCAMTIHVGPTIAAGQPVQLLADGLYTYYPNKTVPIGNITVCAADVANPGKRTNADPQGEELYTFKLSVLPATCDGTVRLDVTCEQARPRTHALGACMRAWARHPSLAHRFPQCIPRGVHASTPMARPDWGARGVPGGFCGR
jgi:hypothetical protein